MRRRADGGCRWYESLPVPGVRLAVFTRCGAAPGLSSPAEARRAARCLRASALFTLRQVHSDRVVFAAPGCAATLPPRADALVTSSRGLALGVRVADCLPVFVYDSRARAVGIAHCGWRGTLARLAPKLARAVSRRLAAPPEALRFALGPCICPGCYPVGEDVRSAFARALPGAERFFARRPGRPARHLLDLRGINRWLLSGLGLAEDGGLELCSAERPGELHSFRAGRDAGRELAAITRL